MDYIYDRIEPNFIRELSKLDDETIKICIYSLICEFAGGVRVPSKRHKVLLAKALIAQGAEYIQVERLISKAKFYKLKNDLATRQTKAENER